MTKKLTLTIEKIEDKGTGDWLVWVGERSDPFHWPKNAVVGETEPCPDELATYKDIHRWSKTASGQRWIRQFANPANPNQEEI